MLTKNEDTRQRLGAARRSAMKFALLLLLLLQLHVLAAAYALPKTMKAVRAATKCNKPFSCVKLATVPVPTPRAGQVLIRLNGSSVNPSDVDTVEVGGCAKGCGADVSGTVVAVGSAARGAAGGAASGSAGGAAAGKVGDEVWGVAFSGGAYAEYVLAATADVSLRPAASAVGAAAAGTVPEVGLTSLFSLKRTGSLPTEPIPAGSPWSASKYKNLTVLITAGSGGTGFIGIEIAKAYGAKHIFTSTTGEGLLLVLLLVLLLLTLISPRRGGHRVLQETRGGLRHGLQEGRHLRVAAGQLGGRRVR